ncbi:MAG: polysaccharide deacetylase family protein [Bacteroidetes bacterium]|nr:polysaccharide deacetylase family protein [Bacteroidota bacterium]
MLCVFCILSCKRTENHVIITFDDANVDEWFAQRELFNNYNIKATFFITCPHKLTNEQIEKLKILVNDGHEIGCHGLNHVKATEENQYQYIEAEIIPALMILSDYGFTVTSFACPFGSATPYLDSMLTNYFSFIRKATYNIRDTLISTYPEIYTHKAQFCNTNAMGIDYNYNISMDNLEDALIKAKQTNTFLVLYAHVIDDSNEDYTISPQYLEELFKKMKKHRIGGETCRGVTGGIVK